MVAISWWDQQCLIFWAHPGYTPKRRCWKSRIMASKRCKKPKRREETDIFTQKDAKEMRYKAVKAARDECFQEELNAFLQEWTQQTPMILPWWRFGNRCCLWPAQTPCNGWRSSSSFWTRRWERACLQDVVFDFELGVVARRRRSRCNIAVAM